MSKPEPKPEPEPKSDVSLLPEERGWRNDRFEVELKAKIACITIDRLLAERKIYPKTAWRLRTVIGLLQESPYGGRRIKLIKRALDVSKYQFKRLIRIIKTEFSDSIVIERLAWADGQVRVMRLNYDI